MRNLVVSLAVPAVMLALTVIAWRHATQLPELFRALLPYGPHIVAVGGMALAWMFNRSRAFFILLLLALAHSVSLPTLAGRDIQTLDSGVIYWSTTVLLPLNVAVFALLSERGILTWRGGLRLGLLSLQVLLVAWLARTSPDWLDGLRVYRASWPAPRVESPISDPAAAVFVVAFVVLLVRVLLRRMPLDGAVLGVLVSSLMAIHVKDDGLMVSLFLTAAGLMLILAIVQESYHMAYVDELTGLPARRALRENLLKLGAHYSIAMVDVDHFKKFNDRYGHDAGDQVLRMVASKLARVSGGGKAYRYGGEEFAVVFPGKALHEAETHLEALCKSVADACFTVRGKGRSRRHATASRGKPRSGRQKQVSVTVSIGCAERNERNVAPMDVLKAADRCLYWAKTLGRNRVCS